MGAPSEMGFYDVTKPALVAGMLISLEFRAVLRPILTVRSHRPTIYLSLFVFLLGNLAAGFTRLLADSSLPPDLPENDQTRSAVSALSDHLPDLAATLLSATLKEDSHSEEEREALLSLLAESQVRAGRVEEGLATLRKIGDRDIATTIGHRNRFWQAQAYAGSGQLREASELFVELSGQIGDEFPYHVESAFSAAALLRALGEPESALPILESMETRADANKESKARSLLALAETQLDLLEPGKASEALSSLTAITGDTPKTAYLRGRIQIAREEWGEAAEVFRSLSKLPEDAIPSAIQDASLLLLSDCEKMLERPDEAISILLAMTESSPDSPLLPQTFERLSQLGFLGKPEIDPRLSEWTTREGEIGALASFFLGVAQMEVDNPDAAIFTFGAFVGDQSFEDHPLRSRALLRLSELQSGLGDKKSAVARLEELSALTKDPNVVSRIEFLRATADFAAGEFQDSQDRFSTSASSSDGAGAAASFNAALAALQAGDEAVFEIEQKALLSDSATAGLGAELVLERGLHLADRDRSVAGPLLEGFLRRYPTHARAAEADLALASLYLLVFPPRILAGRAHIADARRRNLDLALREEADYISFWIEESGGDANTATSRGKEFIKTWPDSPRAPSIRLKVGEIYFRNSDYPNALTQFQLVARDYPDSPLGDQATFFAGKAAMMLTTEASLEQAIELWEKVARGSGPLALPARLHQAKVKQRQNKNDEAIALYDSVLEGNPESDLYFPVVAAKGELIFRTTEPDAVALEPAIEVFAKGIARENIPRRWHLELLYRLGKCHEKADDTTSAVSAYYRAMRLPENPEEGLNPEEYTWFYRCGDAALRLLEKQKNAEAAIAICDRLQAIPGPRAQEAAARAERLRLENFEWK